MDRKAKTALPKLLSHKPIIRLAIAAQQCWQKVQWLDELLRKNSTLEQGSTLPYTSGMDGEVFMVCRQYCSYSRVPLLRPQGCQVSWKSACSPSCHPPGTLSIWPQHLSLTLHLLSAHWANKPKWISLEGSSKEMLPSFWFVNLAISSHCYAKLLTEHGPFVILAQWSLLTKKSWWVPEQYKSAQTRQVVFFLHWLKKC